MTFPIPLCYDAFSLARHIQAKECYTDGKQKIIGCFHSPAAQRAGHDPKGSSPSGPCHRFRCEQMEQGLAYPYHPSSGYLPGSPVQRERAALRQRGHGGPAGRAAGEKIPSSLSQLSAGPIHSLWLHCRRLSAGKPLGPAHSELVLDCPDFRAHGGFPDPAARPGPRGETGRCQPGGLYRVPAAVAAGRLPVHRRRLVLDGLRQRSLWHELGVSPLGPAHLAAA